MKFSLEAEQSVLGGLLLDPNKLDDVLEICQPEDFYNVDNRNIFKAIVDVAGTGKTADVITVSEVMHEADTLDEAGGLGYLVEIANNTPSAANVKAYAQIVADRAMERRITEAGQRIAELGDSDGMAVDDKLDALHGELAGLERKDTTKEVQPLASLLKARLQVMDLKHHGKYPEGIRTGFTEFDKRIQWLNPGDMWVLGGRPGSGKTAMALNVATNVANTGREVLIFSIEMPAEQITDRMIAALSGVDNKRIRSGQLQEDDWHKLSAGVIKLKQMKIEIVDTGGIDIARVKAICRSKARQGNLGLIVIDYLQLVTDRTKKNTIDVVGSASIQIKQIAKACKCPVIALAQLNRKCEERKDKRPMLSDLRETGQIEQDADIVSFMYRDEYYYEDSPNKGFAEIITAKMREGETGKDIIGSQMQYSRFTNVDFSNYREYWQEEKPQSYERKSFN